MSIIPFVVLTMAQRAATTTVPDSGMAVLGHTLTGETPVRMAQDGRNISILYAYSEPSTRSLFLVKSSDMGRNFTVPIKVFTSTKFADFPRHYNIALGGGKTYVSFRQGTNLMLTESTGATFSKPRLLATDVKVQVQDDMMIDRRNQWIGYCDSGLVVAYPSTDNNVKVGRVDPTSSSKSISIKDIVQKKTTSPLMTTTTLLNDAADVSTVRVHVNGRTVRIMADKKLSRYPVWVAGMSLSLDGARNWQVIPEESTILDNHVTYLGYQERGPRIRFRAIATEHLPGEYELTVGRSGREFVAIHGDQATWGVIKWQIVTSADPAVGLFAGAGAVPTQWYYSVDVRPQPTPRPGETVIPPLGPSKPSIFDSRGMTEVFWNQGSLMKDSFGTAWQTSLFPEDMVSRYVGVAPGTPWQTYTCGLWTREVCNSRTRSYWTGTFNDIRTWPIGADVVNVALKPHPTRAGAYQTVFKAKVTTGWSPLNPDEDSGSMDWLDAATSGSEGLLVWRSNQRICVRRVP